MRKQTGLELEEVNFAKSGLDEDVVKSLVAKAGGVTRRIRNATVIVGSLP